MLLKDSPQDIPSYSPSRRRKNSYFIFLIKDWVQSRSFKFWLSWGLGISGIVLIGGTVFSIQSKPQSRTKAPLAANDLTLSLTSPYALAGITPDTSTEEAVTRLQQATKQYEGVFNRVMDGELRKAYLVEAYRMIKLAQKEANSGQFIASNPIGGVDLRKCPEELGNIQYCVLYRYMLEGITAYKEGVEEQDINKLQRGYSRYISALFALNPPPLELPRYDRPTTAMLNILNTRYEIGKRLTPAKVRPELGVETIKLMPATKGATEEAVKQNTIPGSDPSASPLAPNSPVPLASPSPHAE